MINRYTVDPKMYLGKSMTGGGVNKELFFNALNYYIDDSSLIEKGDELYDKFNQMNDFLNMICKITKNNQDDETAIRLVMNIGNENRQNCIPREKAIILVRECRELTSQHGGSSETKKKDIVDTMVDGVRKASDSISDLMVSVNDVNGSDEPSENPGANFLKGLYAVPVLGNVSKFVLLTSLLLVRSIVDNTILFLKIIKVPIDIVKFFQKKDDDFENEDPEAYNAYRKLILRLVGLYGKDTEYVLKLIVKILRDHTGMTFRKYLHDPETNAVFAYKLLTKKSNDSDDAMGGVDAMEGGDVTRVALGGSESSSAESKDNTAESKDDLEIEEKFGKELGDIVDEELAIAVEADKDLKKYLEKLKGDITNFGASFVNSIIKNLGELKNLGKYLENPQYILKKIPEYTKEREVTVSDELKNNLTTIFKDELSKVAILHKPTKEGEYETKQNISIKDLVDTADVLINKVIDKSKEKINSTNVVEKIKYTHSIFDCFTTVVNTISTITKDDTVNIENINKEYFLLTEPISENPPEKVITFKEPIIVPLKNKKNITINRFTEGKKPKIFYTEDEQNKETSKNSGLLVEYLFGSIQTKILKNAYKAKEIITNIQYKYVVQNGKKLGKITEALFKRDLRKEEFKFTPPSESIKSQDPGHPITVYRNKDTDTDKQEGKLVFIGTYNPKTGDLIHHISSKYFEDGIDDDKPEGAGR